MDKDFHFELKILVIGASKVGKTTIVNEICKLYLKRVKRSKIEE